MFPTPFLIDTCIKCAGDVSLSRFHHGCVIYNKRGKVLSTGFNKIRFNPLLSHYDYPKCLLHAESDAILKSNRKDLKNSNLLVIRLGKNKLCNSKPCKHCMSMIYEVGIKHVYYSDVDGMIKQLY
jgi:deoxycytidylate deaminase